MKMMHSPLPVMYKKLYVAAATATPSKSITVTGLENIHTAKCVSLGCGRLERLTHEMAMQPEVDTLEINFIDACPDIVKTVLIKGVKEDGSISKIFRYEGMGLVTCSEEYYYGDCKEIIDGQKYIYEVLDKRETKEDNSGE